MANSKPFEQLTGSLKVYVAPSVEAEPVVNATPAGNWLVLGGTDGEQKMTHGGDLTFFRDNEHQAPVKSVRAEEDVILTYTLVGLTLENYAKVLHNVSNVVAAGGPPATKTIRLKKGETPTEYSILFKGTAISPYGAFPGQYYIPRCVIAGEPAATFTRGGRPGLEVIVHALEDDTQAAGMELGWLKCQVS